MYHKVFIILNGVKNGEISVEAGTKEVLALYEKQDLTDEDIIAHLESKPDKYGHVRVYDEEGDEFTIPVFLVQEENSTRIAIGGDRSELYEWYELVPVDIID